MAYRRLCFVFWLGALALFAGPTHALQVDPTQIIDGNFFARARVVTLGGLLRRDAFVVGKTVTLAGTIGGDAFVLADTVSVTGAVDGSLRGIARKITIDGVVGKNVMVVSGTTSIGKNARVGWDVWVKGAEIRLLGTVDGTLTASGRRIELDGAVRKSVEARIPRNGTFAIGEHANIAGDILFRSPTEGLSVDPKARVQGRINHDERSGPITGRIVRFLLLLVGLAVSGAAALMVPRPVFPPLSRLLCNDFSRCMLAGLAGVVVAGALTVFGMATGVGFGLGLVLLFGLFVGLYLGTLAAIMTLGAMALSSVRISLPPFSTLLVGLGLYALLLPVPIVGPLVRLVAALSGFGAMVLFLFHRWRSAVA